MKGPPSRERAAGRGPADLDEPAPAHSDLWLAAAFLVPNLGVLFCGFVLDDLPLLVENPKLHALNRLGEVWTSGYWPDRAGLALYRPFTETIWALVFAVSGGAPLAFHALNLALGLAVVLLVPRLLVALGATPVTAFLAALLFALFPIHTEATTSVVGSAELLAALLGFGALLSWLNERRALAFPLFALSVLSKESAAALAGVAAYQVLRDPARRARRSRCMWDAALAGLVVGGALLARLRVAAGPSFIPAVDNPAALVDPVRRVLTALWVQVLYVAKTLVPVTLSADYSYKEIPLVMGLEDGRAILGLGLLAGAALLFWRRPADRIALALWAIPFVPAANVLFPIGTLMGERLAYAPSLGLALLVATRVASWRRAHVVGSWRRARVALAVLVLAYAARTFVRNQDWRNADTFYPRLAETSPESAKAHYFLGIWHSSRGDDDAAVAEYDEAVAIFPAYSEAFHNRGNALARLGRREEAVESYRQCLRFDPGHAGAAQNLATLEAGLPLAPPRRKL